MASMSCRLIEDEEDCAEEGCELFNLDGVVALSGN